MDILFERGIPGFETYRYFSVTQVEENKKFNMIISKEDPNIGFLSISPFEIKNDYEINLSEECIEELNIEKAEDVWLLSLVTIGKTLSESTVNLKAPIVINIKNNKGKQLILQSDKYKIKEPLK
jgi:flagellar assembly factor FliW